MLNEELELAIGAERVVVVQISYVTRYNESCVMLMSNSRVEDMCERFEDM